MGDNHTPTTNGSKPAVEKLDKLEKLLAGAFFVSKV
jgi:hypothetical protein